MIDEIKNLVHGFDVAWARHDMEHGGCYNFDDEQLEVAFRKIYDKGMKTASSEYPAEKCAELRRSLRMLLDAIETLESIHCSTKFPRAGCYFCDALLRAERAMND